MFTSWDLVRPRFWYPMSSLEQSMMELEQMSDMMVRPRFLFDTCREMSVTSQHADENSDSDDDDFFVDLPVEARKYKPTALQLPPENEDEGSMEISINKENCHVNAGTDMEVDDDGSDNVTRSETKSAVSKTASNTVKAKLKGKHQNKKHKKQLRNDSYKVTPGDGHNFSSYSFSSSSVVDDQGRRVTTMRRRYEDSTGQLKAVHEREIDGKKMRTTWHRQNKEDEGKYESLCSNGGPEDFEVLWQQTPFGEMQKKTVKGQLQAASDVEGEVASTAAALEEAAMKDTPVTTSSTKKVNEEESDPVSSKNNNEDAKENEGD
ncbi:hypothetical protein V7S43_001530 [Phytophthora oleae]|uniref:Uncharacterized protein n=1 Tax=Phytophthora oleae TaxID=2107226 RepID=A0ABD3G7G0_9STRA